MADYKSRIESVFGLYRIAVKIANDVNKIKVTADSVESVLQMLVDDVDNIEEIKEKFDIDLKQINELLSNLPHNDDLYHSGETVLQHIKWVLEDLNGLMEGKDDAFKQLLSLAALFHDLGKAYTHEIQPEGKHTFYRHAEKSVQIAEVLLAKHKESLGDMYRRLLDLVRLHDTFLALANDRKNAPGSTKYLNKFLREAIYTEGHIDELITLAKADSARSKAESGTIQRIKDVVDDIAKAEAQKTKEEESKTKQRQNWINRQDKIRSLLEAELPEAAEVLPDQSSVNTILGKAKRFDLIKQIQKIISE